MAAQKSDWFDCTSVAFSDRSDLPHTHSRMNRLRLRKREGTDGRYSSIRVVTERTAALMHLLENGATSHSRHAMKPSQSEGRLKDTKHVSRNNTAHLELETGKKKPPQPVHRTHCSDLIWNESLKRSEHTTTERGGDEHRQIASARRRHETRSRPQHRWVDQDDQTPRLQACPVSI